MSHEFIIQNHADIVSCVAMVFVVGLMVQATSPLASVFLLPGHAVEGTQEAGKTTLYTHGRLDMATAFFYTLIVVVVHAVLQEYVLDKLTKKFHLSKTKLAKFNWSGQICVFSLVSAFWAMNNLVLDEKIESLSSLWANYPEDHAKMTFRTKFFFITQIAYWLHCYPELYFQKVKKEDMPHQVTYASLHLVLVAGAYMLNLQQLGSVLLVLHMLCEAVLHAAKLLMYSEQDSHAASCFGAYNVVFVVTRLASLIITLVTVQFGLGTAPNQAWEPATGNYNVPLVRILVLVVACGVQAWMLWSFVRFHLAKRRQDAPIQTTVAPAKPLKGGKEGAKKGRGRASDDDFNSLPEVDQNTRRRR